LGKAACRQVVGNSMLRLSRDCVVSSSLMHQLKYDTIGMDLQWTYNRCGIDLRLVNVS
jgi:hypothetical protein